MITRILGKNPIAIAAVALATAIFATTGHAKGGPKGPSIADVAIEINAETGEFSYLLLAIEAADPAVFETIDGNGQHTVFAPTDAAFLALFAELAKDGVTPADLLADTEFLTSVLLYHVANGRRDAEDVLSSDRIRTLNRAFISQEGGLLNGAIGFDATDEEAANGIIHVINGVLLP